MTLSVHLLRPDSQVVGAPTIAANKACDPGLGNFLNYLLAVDAAAIGACLSMGFVFVCFFFKFVSEPILFSKTSCSVCRELNSTGTDVKIIKEAFSVLIVGQRIDNDGNLPLDNRQLHNNSLCLLFLFFPKNMQSPWDTFKEKQTPGS